MTNIADLIQSSYRRDPSVQPTTSSSARTQTVTRQLSQPTTLARLPISRGGAVSSHVTQLVQSSYRRDPSVQPTTYSRSQMQTVTRQLSQPTTLARLPTSRGGATSSYVTQLAQSSVRRDPSVQPTTYSRSQMQTVTRQLSQPTTYTRGMGGTTLPLPAGRSVISPVTGDRSGILPASTLATQGAFGGTNGGMGASAGSAPSALGPASLGGLSSSISKIGTDLMNTVTSLVPLAIKVVLAVIVIKIVLWLLRGRR